MGHRKATVKHLVTALLKFQRIKTTERKAKEARPLAEKLITLGKRGDTHAKREAYSILADRFVTLKLFKEIVPLFKEKTSGFTRIIPFGFRRGDGASMVILELTEKKMVQKAPKKAKAAKKATSPEAPEARKAPGTAPAGEAPRHKEEPAKKEPPKPKATPKAKLTLEEEKARERARSEDKKIEDRKGKTFLQNLRGRFRKRGTD
jgi:large subunit ribosomal protein L17